MDEFIKLAYSWYDVHSSEQKQLLYIKCRESDDIIKVPYIANKEGSFPRNFTEAVYKQNSFPCEKEQLLYEFYSILYHNLPFYCVLNIENITYNQLYYLLIFIRKSGRTVYGVDEKSVYISDHHLKK